MKAFKLLVVTLLVGLSVNAQDNFFAVTYNTALPMGETQEYINDFSWGIIGLEWKKMMSDNVSVGLNVAWQVFSQKRGLETVELSSNTAISGTQLRYLNSFPITLTGTYHFNPEGRVIPFVGVGAGLYRMLDRFDISGFVSQNNTWNFGFYPEAGIIVPTGGNSDFFVNTKYHYILPANGGRTDTYLNINVGLSYFY